MGTGIVFYGEDDALLDAFGVTHTVGSEFHARLWAVLDAVDRLASSGFSGEARVLVTDELAARELSKPADHPITEAVERICLRHGIALKVEVEGEREAKTAGNVAKRASLAMEEQQKRLRSSSDVRDVKRVPGEKYAVKDYEVDWVSKTCTCSDFKYKCRDIGLYCKHVLAVARVRGEELVTREKTLEELMQEIESL